MSGTIKALIVDDYPDARKEIAEYLEVMRHSYLEAGAVKDARDILKENKFDYVVLDLQIPQKKGSTNTQVDFGMELLDEIIRDYPGVGILVVSGEGKDTRHIVEVMKRSGQGAAISFVAKPYNSDGNTSLRNEVKALLDQVRQNRNSRNVIVTSVPDRPVNKEVVVIDLCCETLPRKQYAISINGQKLKIAQQQLNILICFGRAQRDCATDQEKKKAAVEYEIFGIGNQGVDTNLNSAFGKLNKIFLQHVSDRLISSCGHAKWKLEAVIENLAVAEQYYGA